MADFSFEEVGEILRALERLDYTSVSLECGDLKLELRRDAGPAPAATVPAAPEEQPRHPAASDQVAAHQAPAREVSAGEVPAGEVPAGEDVPPHWVAVTAPMVGTFYRAPGPGEPPFVEVGDRVGPGTTVGILEVMKLFTELAAEKEGKVARIDAEDAALVESGQALVWIEPS